MKTLRILLLIAICGFTTNHAMGQNYNNMIGARLGFAQGLTFRHYTSNSTAIELIGNSRWKGFNFTALFEKHMDLSEPGLRWFYGGGGHIGFWRGYANHPWFYDDRSYMVIGVDGILGMDYTFADAPVNISLDWKPAFNLVGYTGFWGDGGALSVRYVF